ncbi:MULTISPECIES: cytochrome P450 [unclassified Streptomyces]|uniref:cytochrome P450 n=1 Tax=unclassified Streptomyces TaxID=2593676 RepID=UPI00234AEAD2|nr:cytochrome P450 [Streptomyces sp. M92]WCN02037.1 cytochrome P450 [Streptomyces sp. M92]
MTVAVEAGRCPMHAAPGIDLFASDTFATTDVHAVWRTLRREAPISWHPVGDDGFWSVTRYDDVRHVLRDHVTFTSEKGSLLTLLGKGDPAGGRQMAVTDPPRHARLREPLQRALSVREVERDLPRIRSLILELLAPMKDGGVFDFAAATAAMPMAVIGSWMRLPRADWPELTRLTGASIAPDDPAFVGPGGPERTLVRAHRELFAYFQDVVAERQAAPGDDLLGVLLGMQVDGARLTPGEIVSNCYSLLLGANVTTAQPPSAALLELAGTDALADWAAHPDLLVSGVEEALRWSSPAQHFMRYATRDVRIRDITVHAGDAVVAWLGSANRDEAVFARPDTFDVRRRPNRHVAFGVGPHYCVGHSVARVALRVMFQELLTGFTDIRVVGDPVRLRSNFIAGYTSLPVTARGVRP